MCPPGGPESMRRTGTPSGERPEAVRIWLLGGFRVTVGSRTIDDSAGALGKRQVYSSCSPSFLAIASTVSR